LKAKILIKALKTKMKAKKVIVLTFDELFTKSEKVRKKWLNILEKQLKEKGLELIGKERFKFFIEFSEENLKKVKKIFGIRNIYLGFVFKNLSELKNFLEKDFNSIENELKDLIEGNDFSFKIKTKRHWKKLEKNSLEISKEFGYLIQKLTNWPVDLENPKLTLIIEVFKEKVLFLYKKIEGLGGLPLNTQPKTLCLFSGGIDSPVASYLIAKRGSNQDFLFFNSAGDFYLSQVLKPFFVLKDYLINPKFYVLDISEYLKEFEKVRKGYRQLALKWFFYKIAEKFVEKNKYKAFIVGESLAQVSTQTLNSLNILDKTVNCLVLRPLIALDKLEIKKIAEKIGTLNFSEKVEELCTIETNSLPIPNEKIFKEEIKKLDFDFEEIVNKIKKLEEEDIKDLLNFQERLIRTMKNKDLVEIKVKSLDKEELEKIKEEILKNEKRLAILYCKTGRKAYLVKKILEKELKDIKNENFSEKELNEIKRLIK